MKEIAVLGFAVLRFGVKLQIPFFLLHHLGSQNCYRLVDSEEEKDRRRSYSRVVYRVRNSCSKTMCDLTIIPENYQARIRPLHEAHQHAAYCVHHQALELVLLCGSCASGGKDCDVEFHITHFVGFGNTFNGRSLRERLKENKQTVYSCFFFSFSCSSTWSSDSAPGPVAPLFDAWCLAP